MLKQPLHILEVNLHCTKIKFYIKDFFSKCDQIRRPADFVTFTEENLNGKLHFLCSVSCKFQLKDQSKKDHQHDVAYNAKCPEEKCT